MASNTTVPAIRVPLLVTYETFKHDRERFPDSTLTEEQVRAYCELHANNPAEAWKVCPVEFFQYWEIHARAGAPPELDAKGLTDAQAGEPNGYSKASGRGPIRSNTKADHLKREITLLDAHAAILREKAAMEERHQKQLEDALAATEAKAREEQEKEEKRKALEKKNKSEAAKKTA